MKQIKTAYEILKESGVYPEDFISFSTMGGCECHVYVTRVSVDKENDVSEFEKELQEHSAPTPEIEAIPLRMII